jgi:periplasmic protein TonB
MSYLRNTLPTAIFLLMLGGSTLVASAQTTLPINENCPIRNAPPRPLTFHAAEPPLLPALNYVPNGTAIVRFELTENGTPKNATIEKSSGSYLLDQAAMKTVLHQEFAPEVRDCVPVAGSYLYEVDY